MWQEIRLHKPLSFLPLISSKPLILVLDWSCLLPDIYSPQKGQVNSGMDGCPIQFTKM